MKKIVKQAIALALCLACVVPVAPARAAEVGAPVKVGLYYGDNAMAAANLKNSTGSGYYMGYTAGDGGFYSVAYTGETEITMLKTQNMYLSGGTYSSDGGSGTVIGCYHLQVGAGYAGFDEANTLAAQYAGGFPAWVEGTYSVRVGAYPSRDAAAAARDALGLTSAEVVGTSGYGIHVVKTKTGDILFQFDGGESTPLTVRPGLDESVKAVTWFKGFRYYGDFRYERIKGGNMTVVNVVEMDDYINCVISQEMSDSWPLEALKAQAICARTYAESNRNNHKSHNFELCATVCCQAYPGVGRIGENTTQAAAETSGLHVWYGGELASTVYSSSNGGASESVENVWTKASPYLVGKPDPYEALVADKIPNYNWSKTFTKTELEELLRGKGYQCASIVNVRVSQVSPTGNAVTVTFTDSDGKNYSFSKEKAKLMLGLRSMRYTISGGGQYYVDDAGAALGSVNGVYAIGSDGVAVQVGAADMPYIITSSGTQQLTPPGDTFTATGTGWGHNVGMSQWGANAMATQGKTCEEILKFYYTGIELY